MKNNTPPRTLVVKQSKWLPDPAKQLNEFRHQLFSQKLSSPNSFRLHVWNVELSPAIITALVDLLNVTLPLSGEDGNNNIAAAAATTTIQWHAVYLRQCRMRILKETSPTLQVSPAPTSSYGTQHSHHNNSRLWEHLGSALASRVSTLTLEESPDVLDCLFLNHATAATATAATSPLGSITKFRYQRHNGLSGLQCLLLGGALLRSHEHLKELYLHSTLLESPDRLAVGIATAFRLEVLSLVGVLGSSSNSNSSSSSRPRTLQRRKGLADLIVSRDEFGYGAVARLLQNPSSRLRSLNLSNLGLEEDHLVQLSRILVVARESDRSNHQRGPRLEELNVSQNDIRAEGILAFAALVPHMSLKKVSLLPNPAWNSSSTFGCGAALLESMRLNTSIEYLEAMEEAVPQGPLLRYYAGLNRAGRRVLTTPCPVPWGLWPSILERAGRIDYFPSNDDHNHGIRHSAIYFLLQNSPIVASSSYA